VTKGHGHASIWGLGVGGGRAGRAIGGKRDPKTNHAFEGVFRDILVRAKTVDRSPRSSWARAARQKNGRNCSAWRCFRVPRLSKRWHLARGV